MDTKDIVEVTNKDKLQDRLASMKVLAGVLPTRRLDRKHSATVMNVISDVGYDQAMRSVIAFSGLANEVKPGVFERLQTSNALSAQVIGFAAAGLGLFEAAPAYAELSLKARGANGGNGAVTRVLLSGERLLLETPRVIVRFSEGAPQQARDEIAKKFQLIPIRSLKFAPGLFQFASNDLPGHEVAMKLMAFNVIEHAMPDFIEFFGQRHTPNDPEFGRQWHHKSIRAEAAWDETRGAKVRIAVIDNGFDTGHPDLRFGQASGCYRPSPDLADADFVRALASIPISNHGTACAGMAAARSGTGSGGCGVAFESELMAIACLGDQVGTQTTLARAIAYAADPSSEPGSELGAASGADLIACSLGPNSAAWEIRPVLDEALNFAASAGRGGLGTPIFWATTNGNFPISADEVASHNAVIAVGRSTDADNDDGSGYGPELAFLAPGVNVYVPRAGGGYQTTTGTSFACPCAAAVGGLVLAVNSRLTIVDVMGIMHNTCDKIGDLPYTNGRNDRFGRGRINAELAVQRARSHIPTPNRFAGA